MTINLFVNISMKAYSDDHPVTSLGRQEGQEFSERGLNFFNYV